MRIPSRARGALVVAAASVALAGCGAPAPSAAPVTVTVPAPEDAAAQGGSTAPTEAAPPTGAATPPAATGTTSTSLPPPADGGTAPQAPLAAQAVPAGRPVVPAAARARPSRGGVRLPPTSAQGPLHGRTIVVDPGHNGTNVPSILNRQVPAGGGKRKACNTTGTANNRTPEHALTWSVANALANDLRGRGATVVMTRPDDKGVGPCVNERAAIGNRAGADLVVSVHADGNTGASARGFHVIRSTSMSGGAAVTDRSRVFAERAVEQLRTTPMPVSTYLGGGSGITPRADIAGLNLSTIPAVMVEMGNMRHPADAALFGEAEFREAVAASLADAAQAMTSDGV